MWNCRRKMALSAFHCGETEVRRRKSRLNVCRGAKRRRCFAILAEGPRQHTAQVLCAETARISLSQFAIQIECLREIVRHNGLENLPSNRIFEGRIGLLHCPLYRRLDQ